MDRYPRLDVDNIHAYNGYSPIDNEYNKKYRNPVHSLSCLNMRNTKSSLVQPLFLLFVKYSYSHCKSVA